MSFSVQNPHPQTVKNKSHFLLIKGEETSSLSPPSYLLKTLQEKRRRRRKLAMLRSSVNVFFFLLLMSLTIHSQETQADHHYSPAPAPVAHGPKKAPGPIASQPTAALPMYGATPGSLHPQECAGRCGDRCSATAYKKPCLFFCQKCCASCLCVPPGTYGNKQVCPCYNNWKTKRGGPKCP